MSLTVTLHPSASLAAATTYLATVKGGASGVKDAAGNALALDKTWTFTTEDHGEAARAFVEKRKPNFNRD